MMKKERAETRTNRRHSGLKHSGLGNSLRVSDLCQDLKAQLDELDKPAPKSKEPSPSQKIKNLFEELKEKLNTVS